MSGDHINSFLEVLSNTFVACDEDGSGVVEINKLIDFLVSQVSNWQGDESVREEIHNILSGVSDNLINKEDFIKYLLERFKTSFYQENDENIQEIYKMEAERCSSSTSGIEDITSGSSTNSLEGISAGVNFVSDGQIFTNDESVDEIPLNDSGSSQAESRLVKTLQSEITALLRKNEYLENFKNSLVGQISYLEDTLVKKNKELEDNMKQLKNTNKLLELQTQKQEETEDKLNFLKTKNKSVTVELSQTERENSKLKMMISEFEKNLQHVVNENMKESVKVQEITTKFNKLNDLYHNSKETLEQELEQLKLKETEREEVWMGLLEENRNLHSQLDSTTLYAQDLKSKLTTAIKELSDIKNARKKDVMQINDDADNLLSTDNSMVSTDENFSSDDTIPFEKSLLAELQDEFQMKSDKQECCNVCMQNLALFTNQFDSTDATSSTNTKETVNKATMTTFLKPEELENTCSSVEYKDVGVECSIKVMSWKKKILSKIGFYQKKKD